MDVIGRGVVVHHSWISVPAYLLYDGYRLAQSLMTVMVAVFLSLNLYIAYLFNTPYTGDLSVKKDSFIVVRKFIDNYP